MYLKPIIRLLTSLISYFKIQLPLMLIKVATAFALGIEVLVFAMIPYFYCQTFSKKKIIHAFNNFSAGLFLGITFFHILPQSNTSLTSWKSRIPQTIPVHPTIITHHHNEIPYGSLICILTFIAVLGIEVYMNDGLLYETVSQRRNNNHMHEVLTNQKIKMRRRIMLETYLTQAALSVHSFFQCMSIGVENKEKVVMTLAGAVLLHKWAQALTLGFSYSISGMPRQTALKFTLFHAILNSGAVVLGYTLSQTSDLVKGITNGISGGTFLYISMIVKISKNFGNKDELLQKLGLIIAGLIFSIMILL